MDTKPNQYVECHPVDIEFEKELITLLNKYSKENDSNTADNILAGYLIGCLESFNRALRLKKQNEELSDL